MLDPKAIAEATAKIVREHVEKATAPLVQRIAELEARSPERGAPGADGLNGKDGRDGKDVDPAQIASFVERAVAEAVAGIPAPERGEPGAAGERGADGQDGKDADPEHVRTLIDEAVAKAVAALPAPPVGERGTDGAPGERGATGDNGKDGAGIADLLIDRDGALIATFTDGRMKSLGRVEGRDGAQGVPGVDGVDGVGFDDMTFAHDGERGFVLRFSRGEKTKEFPFAVPVVLDRGVFREGAAYQKGDGATFGGSFWIAQTDTAEKPGVGEDWRLAVKRGRDGKDAAPRSEKAAEPVRVGLPAGARS
jgi:integrin beta 3